MALTKQTHVDLIQITADGSVQVRRATQIEEDGVRLGSVAYHRVSYDPGVPISHEDTRVQAVAAAVWTPAVIAAANAKRGRGPA